MKKKLTCMIICIISVFLLAGCGKSSALNVYVVQTDALYKDAVSSYQEEHSDVKLEVTYFNTYEDMKEKMSAEVMRGKGPDVLLFNGLYNTDDTFKMASSGNLLTLDDKMASLDKDEYFDSMLEAGQAKGHQYFLPFSWNIMQAYSSQAIISERGYSDDLYAAFEEEALALADDDASAVSSTQFGRRGGRADMLNIFFETAGIELIDWQTGVVNEDKEAVKKISDFVKVLYDNKGKISEISKRYANDFEGAVAHFTYLMEDFSFMNNLRYYQSVYPWSVNEEMYFAPFTNENGGITAQVIQYGAINGNTDKEDMAWDLLCYILDYKKNMHFSKYDENAVYYAPVNKTVYAAYVDELATTEGPGFNKKRVEPLEEAWVKVLDEIPTRVDSAIIGKTAVGELVKKSMETYLLGKRSFDVCYEDLMDSLQKYIEE